MDLLRGKHEGGFSRLLPLFERKDSGRLGLSIKVFAPSSTVLGHYARVLLSGLDKSFQRIIPATCRSMKLAAHVPGLTFI